MAHDYQLNYMTKRVKEAQKALWVCSAQPPGAYHVLGEGPHGGIEYEASYTRYMPNGHVERIHRLYCESHATSFADKFHLPWPVTEESDD